MTNGSEAQRMNCGEHQLNCNLSTQYFNVSILLYMYELKLTFGIVINHMENKGVRIGTDSMDRCKDFVTAVWVWIKNADISNKFLSSFNVSQLMVEGKGTL